METKFQTSFIPKRPIVPQESVHTRSGVSILMVIATILFIISLSGAGFVFTAKKVLLSSQEKLKTDLAENEKRFNAPLIEDLKKANLKIDLASQLLKNHIAVSEIFNIISKLTIDGVRFSSFEFTAPDTSLTATGKTEKAFKISMKGLANSYSSVAFQSDVFGRSQKYGTNKVIRNPILSDLSVDQNGNVNFNFSAEIVQSDISYEKTLIDTLQSEGSLPTNQ